MNPLYFNHAFARPPLRECIEVMRPLLEAYEDPLSESAAAQESEKIIGRARDHVAALLNASSGEVHFTSSGTESNNWALKGAVAASRSASQHIVVSSIEHFSVHQTALYLQRHGVDLTFVPVGNDGLIDPSEIMRAIRSDTTLVSIIAGNDEIGAMQDLAAIARLKSAHPGVLFHTDAIQHLCYEPLDTKKLAFDLVSISSNAIFGPSGIAALYVREGTHLAPLLHGGMQEEGMRPGLQSIALAAGFGEAARINALRKTEWKEQLLSWRDAMFAFYDRLQVPVTASRSRRLCDNVHGIVDVDGEAMMTLLGEDGILASTGSTCSRYAQKESHVLKSLGVTSEQARGALLLTGGPESISALAQVQSSFEEALLSLRALKPW